MYKQFRSCRAASEGFLRMLRCSKRAMALLLALAVLSFSAVGVPQGQHRAVFWLSSVVTVPVYVDLRKHHIYPVGMKVRA